MPRQPPVKTFDVQGLRVNIRTDEYAESPEEYSDSPVYLAHFHRRFSQCHKELPFRGPERFVEWKRAYEGKLRSDEDSADAPPEFRRTRAKEMQEEWACFDIATYIHSGIVLALSGSGTAASFPDQMFDVSHCGAVLIRKDESYWGAGQTVKEGQEAPSWKEIAEWHLKAWNQYLAGEVYCFEILRVDICNLGHEHTELIESGENYYGGLAEIEADARSLAEFIAARPA